MRQNYYQVMKTKKHKWIPILEEIPDEVAKNAVINARFSYFCSIDDDNLNQLVEELNECLGIFEKQYPEDSDIDTLLNHREWLASHGFPMKEALALWTIREVSVGNYGAAVHAFTLIEKEELTPDANLGRKRRQQQREFGRKRHSLQKPALDSENEKIKQEFKDFKERHPNASNNQAYSYIESQQEKLGIRKLTIDSIKKIIAKSNNQRF